MNTPATQSHTPEHLAAQAIALETVNGLREYHPQLDSEATRAALQAHLATAYKDTGNAQNDYERLRDEAERWIARGEENAQAAHAVDGGHECDRTPAPGMNEQTPGPLEADSASGLLWPSAMDKPVAGMSREAFEFGNRPATTQERANARLLAASYTLLDRTGREFGIDAATLAESLDLVGLIRAGRAILEAHKEQDPTAQAMRLDRAISDLNDAIRLV